MRGRDDASQSAFAESLQRAITAFASRRTAATDYALVRFAERPTLVVDFTADADSVAGAAGDLTALGGRTALYDTFVFALARAEQSRRPKQAIVLVSDGYDSRFRAGLRVPGEPGRWAARICAYILGSNTSVHAFPTSR